MRCCKLCGLGGILGLVLALASTARAEWPAGTRDHRGEKPDLSIYRASVNSFNNKVVIVGVKNIGKQPAGIETKLRVQMYKMVNGKYQLYAAYFAPIPKLGVGGFKWIHVTMPAPVTNCYVTVHVDALGQLAESNENNNSTGFRR